jgi:serine protease Do
MNSDNEFKSFFLKGLIIVLIAVVFLVIGGISMLGVLAVVNKVTIADLFKRSTETGEQEDEQGAGEKEAGAQATGEQRDAKSDTDSSEEFILSTLDDAISKVVEEVAPSVVNIEVTVKAQDIFGRIYEEEGVGSGVIYSEDGYIITNNHVAGGAEKLVVTLYDGSDYPAVLVGSEERYDVAVIKIEKNGLKAADFFTEENYEVGDMVIAIGSPYGLQQSVTMGVISAKGRDITIPVNLIQTDAAINRGNSGGPLVNSSGEVIGINTMIISSSGENSGIGFAIPSNTVTNIADQIIEYGKAKIPYMGIRMDPYKGEGITGVYVSDVEPGYPAADAGIKAGDVIAEVNGAKVSNPYELFAQILRHSVGDSIDVRLNRDGDIFKFSVILVETPQNEG